MRVSRIWILKDQQDVRQRVILKKYLNKRRKDLSQIHYPKKNAAFVNRSSFEVKFEVDSSNASRLSQYRMKSNSNRILRVTEEQSFPLDNIDINQLNAPRKLNSSLLSKITSNSVKSREERNGFYWWSFNRMFNQSRISNESTFTDLPPDENYNQDRPRFINAASTVRRMSMNIKRHP